MRSLLCSAPLLLLLLLLHVFSFIFFLPDLSDVTLQACQVWIPRHQEQLPMRLHRQLQSREIWNPMIAKWKSY